MEAAAAHAAEGTAAGVASAKAAAAEGAAAHAAESAARGGTGRSPVVARRAGRIIAGTRAVARTIARAESGARRRRRAAAVPAAGRACHITSRERSAVVAEQTADGCNEEPEHQHCQPQQDHQRQEQHHKGRDHLAEAHVVVSRFCRTAVQAHAIHLCDGICHIVGAGHYGRVVIPVHEVILHGLGNGAGLTFQHRIAETVAIGDIIIPILIERRLHHQQDQHTVIFRR